MRIIANLFDQTSSIFIEQWTPKVPSNVRYIAYTVAFFIGMLTLGIVVGSLWKKLRPIEDENDTDEVVRDQFRRVVGSPISRNRNVEHHYYTPFNSSESLTQLENAKLPQQKTPVSPVQVETPLRSTSLENPPTSDDSAISNPFQQVISDTLLEISRKKQATSSSPQPSAVSSSGEISATLPSQKKDFASNNEKNKEQPVKPFRSDQFYKDSSYYGINSFLFQDSIQIRIVRAGLKRVPEFHLHKLAEKIEEKMKHQGKFQLSVDFLNEDLRPDEGFDAGGLSRDFLDELFEGILHSPKFSFQTSEKSSLVLPQAKNVGTLQSFPSLSDEEKILYQEMGKVMMYCHHFKPEFGRSYLIGRRFEDALFQAILCLTVKEIDTPFEQLSLQTQLKMCQALLNGRTEAGMDLKFLQQRLDWLTHFDRLSPEQFSEAASHLLLSDNLSQDLTLNNKGEAPDLEKIQQDKGKFKDCLLAALFCLKGQHGQLGTQLAPIHAIAQGMKLLCYPSSGGNINNNWDSLCKTDYKVMSNTIQGCLDRNEIANLFKLRLPDSSSLYFITSEQMVEMEKKVNWLKEWIKDEKGATEEELKKLLKFMMGSTGFKKDTKIEVRSQTFLPYNPVPIAHTCSFFIELAPMKSQYGRFNDHTKENLIESLKELALRNHSSYQIR